MNDESIDPAPLRQAAEIAIDYLAEMAKRPVGRPIEPDALRATLGGDLPERGEDPEVILERLVRDADPGLVSHRRASLLRVRHRWKPPRNGCDRVAGRSVGPERRE